MIMDGYHITPHLRWVTRDYYLPSGKRAEERILEQLHYPIIERMEDGLLVKQIDETDQRWVIVT